MVYVAFAYGCIMAMLSENSRWWAPDIPGKAGGFYTKWHNPNSAILSAASWDIIWNTLTLDLDSTASANLLESVVISLREVARLAAIRSIVPPIPSTDPLAWLDAKKFQWTLTLNVFSNHKMQLAMKWFLNLEFGLSGHMWRTWASLWSKEITLFLGQLVDSFECGRSLEITTAV